MIEGAKKVADERQVSLSRMVADFLRALKSKKSSPDLKDLPPKTRSLHGVLRGHSVADERAEYREFIEKKYS